MSDEKILAWAKSIGLAFISFVALFFSRKNPVLKWIVASLVMVFMGVILYFGITSGLPEVAFPFIIIALNIGVCLIIKAPKKWIVVSTTSLLVIFTAYAIRRLTPSPRKTQIE